MSRPIPRIVFSVLIAFVLVFGIYSSVHGAVLSSGTKYGHVNFALAQRLGSPAAQGDTYHDGGCHSGTSVDPDG